jgi:hypothetical protein
MLIFAPLWSRTVQRPPRRSVASLLNHIMTPALHGGNTGSIPVGRASISKTYDDKRFYREFTDQYDRHETCGPAARACLPAHAVKGVAEAILSGVADVKAGRHEGAAFTPFIDDAIRTRRKVKHPGGGRCLLR